METCVPSDILGKRYHRVLELGGSHRDLTYMLSETAYSDPGVDPLSASQVLNLPLRFRSRAFPRDFSTTL